MDQLVTALTSLGLPGVFLLMALESSIVPVPSELVMIPIGFMASKGQISAPIAVLVWGLGSIFGAWINYLLGRYLGKAVLLKYGKYLLITHQKYEYAERLFDRNDKLYTFLGRFIPVVRHLISIPAGIFRMDPKWFTVLTFAGATIWCSVLTATGYYLGPPVLALVHSFSNQANVVFAAIVVIAAIWFIRKK